MSSPARLLSGLGLVLCALGVASAGGAPIPVHLSPPGAPEGQTVKLELVPVKDAQAGGDAFSMEVVSVSCGDSRCKPVPVRLFWDELGFYRHYELAPGAIVEKGNGEPFTDADYEKLDRVIARRDSGLRMVQFANVAGYQAPAGDVDAVTAPTVPLDARDYVKGAFWTSYTLWHWANSQVPGIIRGLTGRARTLEQLRRELLAGDRAHRLFALEQLQVRKATDPETVKVAVRGAADGDYELRKSLLAYLELADATTYYATLERLIHEGDADLRVLCLNAMSRTHHQPPEGYLDRLARELAGSPAFQELDLFLKIVEQRGGASPAVSASLMPLLDAEDFLVARRVYWFLSRQELSKLQRRSLKAFREKHANHL